MFAGYNEQVGISGPFADQEPARPVNGAFLTDLTRGFDSETQALSNWVMDAGWLKADFSPHNVRFDRSGMTLSVTRRNGGPTPYVSAEFARAGFYGFGRYEVVMKSAKMQGVVSSFFTHTGEFLGDPHSEVDFEFVGGKPREVHTNYFWEGASDAVDVALWFDASQDFHLYAYEWSPERITWFVDGIEVRRVEAASAAVPIPTVPGRVMASIWAANNQAVEWAGEPEGEGASVTYACMSHVPTGQAGRQCSDSFAPPLP
jgi:endo-1,3-1,4-beta-glycanase ExoK